MLVLDTSNGPVLGREAIIDTMVFAIVQYFRTKDAHAIHTLVREGWCEAVASGIIHAADSPTCVAWMRQVSVMVH